MQFFKKGDVYTIIRTTGSQDNILGVTLAPVFDKQIQSSRSIEVIEWDFSNISKDKGKVLTSKQEVMEQVLEGLDHVNLALGTEYRLAKIYFYSSDSSANQVYSGLISQLIRHYHNGNKFKEI